METVSLAINEKGLVKGLRHSFTNRDTLLKELLQNCERAGATRVDVTMEPEGATMLKVTIRDDGCGIEDMSKLLTIATSGWSGEVIESRMPYGIGFLASVYAAKSIEVASRGRVMRFLCEDVLNFQPVEVREDPASLDVPGSRITLHGLTISLSEAVLAVQRHGRGYPIPVCLNGEELKRPHALTDEYQARSCGHIRVEGLEEGIPPRSWKFYLQSFLVYSTGCFESPGVVVHLDPKRFIARLPDRDRLIDEDLKIREVQEEVRAVWREHLEKARARMPIDEFLTRYVRAIRDYHPEMLDDVDWLPATLYTAISEPPSLRNMEFRLNRGSTHLSRKDIETGRVTLVTGCMPDDSEEIMAAWMYAYLRKCLYIGVPWISSTHWAWPYIRDISNIAVEIELQGRHAEGWFSGRFCSGDVILCEAYRLRAKDIETGAGLGEIVESCEPMFDNRVERTEDGTGACFIVPDGAAWSGWVVQQASDYRDEWHDREDAFDEDVASFNRKVTELRGAQPSDVMLDLLVDQLPLDDYPVLHGRRFLVTVGQDGRLEGVAEVTLHEQTPNGD